MLSEKKSHFFFVAPFTPLSGEHVTRASHLYNYTWRTCKPLAQVTCSTSASYSHKYCRTKSLAQVQFYLENMQLTRTSHLHNPNWRGTSHSRKSPVKLFLENTHVTLARHVMYCTRLGTYKSPVHLYPKNMQVICEHHVYNSTWRTYNSLPI